MNKKDISLKYYAYYMLKTECFLKGYIAKCLMSPLEMCMKPVNAAGKLRNKSLLKMDKAVTIFLPDSSVLSLPLEEIKTTIIFITT